MAAGELELEAKWGRCRPVMDEIGGKYLLNTSTSCTIREPMLYTFCYALSVHEERECVA